MCEYFAPVMMFVFQNYRGINRSFFCIVVVHYSQPFASWPAIATSSLPYILIRNITCRDSLSPNIYRITQTFGDRSFLVSGALNVGLFCVYDSVFSRLSKLALLRQLSQIPLRERGCDPRSLWSVQDEYRCGEFSGKGVDHMFWW